MNYSNIARDSGVDSKTSGSTTQTWSTLLGSFIEPFKRSQSRHVIGKAPKF